MFWGRKSKTQADHLLVLDIGSTDIKAAVFDVEDNIAHIVAISRIAQEPGSMRGGMIVNLPSVTATCDEAIAHALGESDISISSMILGVNGQLVETVTTTVHYDRAHPEHPLEHGELKNIIYKIQQRSSDKLKTSLREKFADDHPDIQLIHAGVVDVQLDGYVVENPVGFQGKRLTLTIFNAYIPLVHLSILQNLAQQLRLNILSVATEPYGLSKVFVEPQASTEEQNGIFIDIGGGTTDVVIVKNGSVEGIQSFAFGGESFTRHLARVLNKPFDKAEKMKLDYVNSRGDKRGYKKISEALMDASQIWLDGVMAALGEFHDMKILPSRIYLTGGSAPLPELRRVLLTKQWSEQLPFSRKPYPAVLKPDDLKNVVNETGEDWTPQDIPLLALTKLALELTSPDDVVTNTLQSITRTMQP